MTTILAVSGSIRHGSTNAAALATVRALAAPDTAVVIYEGLAALPHFNPDDDVEGVSVHPTVRGLRSMIGSCDAVLICTPEYAGALPGAFKNLLEWTVGGGELCGKPVAWINVSGVAAPTGGADAHDSLRRVLGYVAADIVEAACERIPLARSDVGADGLIADAALRDRLLAAVEALVAAI